MKADDLLLIVAYAIFCVVGVTLSVIKIIKAKTKDEVFDGWGWLVVSFTPGILLVGFLLLFIWLMFLIYDGPTWIISKIKRMKE